MHTATEAFVVARCLQHKRVALALFLPGSAGAPLVDMQGGIDVQGDCYSMCVCFVSHSLSTYRTLGVFKTIARTQHNSKRRNKGAQ